jgi:hypothetical protein
MEEYGDTTGLMGYSTAELGTPVSCFNGQKNDQLGWYSDRTLSLNASITASKTWGGRLFAFVDYDKTPADGHVLIKVGNMFIQWNRAKSFNNETREHRDKVTIVYNFKKDKGSWLLGTVSPDEAKAFRFWNFLKTGFDLVIEACEASPGPPEFLKMSIHLDDGVQKSSCGVDLTPSPSSSPTESAYCEDSHNLTFSWQGRERTCTWLLGSPVRREHLCAATQNHQARVVCPETCGVCTDFCEDSQGDFYVNHKQLKKNCAWLSVRSKWQSRLCHRDDVKSLCKESCNTCDAAPP